MFVIVKTSPPMEKMGKAIFSVRPPRQLSAHAKHSIASRVASDWAHLPLVGGLAGYELAADGAAN